LIASNSGTPELIAFGTTITPYFSTLAVPTTTLALTDRLALRYYVARSGRTITMHTENSHLCQIITTFTTGLTALNGLTAQVQNFATGTSGTDFAISSATNIHTFNIPTASATNRGLLSSADWTTFNNKAPSVAGGYVPYTGAAANVDLGVYNLTASAVNVNGSGSNAGVINLESNAIFPLVNGYGTIGSGTTNQFNFYQTTGAGVFRGAILSLNSIPDSVTRTYTLPNADGTLALSSDLGNYVTLSTTQTIVGQKTFTSPLTIGTTGNSIIYEQSGNLIFQTGASADLTIPSSGAATFGFGLNVTGALDVTGALSGTSATWSNINVFTGASVGTGSQRWIGSDGGAGLFLNTPTGSGINLAINNNPVLGIASTGAVGIGTASPSAKLHVEDSSGVTRILVDNTANAAAGSGIYMRTLSGGSIVSNATLRVDNAGNFQIYSGASSDAIRLHCSANGNTGIGTASPLSKLNVEVGSNTDGIFLSRSGTNKQSILILGDTSNGASISGGTNPDGTATQSDGFGRLILQNGPAEGFIFQTSAVAAGSAQNWQTRMVLKNNGNLGINNTNPGSKIDLNQQTSDWSIITRMTAASGLQVLGYLATISNQAPNNTNSYLYYGEDNIALRFAVYSNGGIANYATNNVILSDERLKKDIEPLESYWDKFKAIEIVKYKYKDQTHDDFNIGVIAQQVEAIAPEFVDIDGWDTKPKFDEEGNEIVSDEEPLKSVYYSDLHHATIKVLQEAMTKIEELQEQINSLKNQIK